MVSGGIAPGLLGTAQPCRSCCCLRNAPLMPCGISGQGAKSAGAGVPLAFMARLRVLLGWFMAEHPPDLAVKCCKLLVSMNFAAQAQRCGPCPCSGCCPHHPAVPLTYPKVGAMCPWRPWPCSWAAGRSGSIVCHPVSAQVRPPPGDPVPAPILRPRLALEAVCRGQGAHPELSAPGRL